MNEESENDFFDSITRFGMGTAIIGFTVFVMSYIFVTCLNHAAENQVNKKILVIKIPQSKCKYRKLGLKD